MYPFTPTQWQELEHQALIYKYMASGIPIPPDLLLPFRSSFFLNAPATAPPNFPQPTMGWSCCYQQMGYGRKAEDPEPGRCRRTDGKKWRCSKEAYPDSKYCERHMHRGKNRSRKPVEISLNNNNNHANTTTNNNNSNTTNTTSSTPFSLPPLSTPASHDSSYYPYQLHYPHNQRDYNKLCYGGVMKDADEYAFLSEASAGSRGSSWELTPLGLGEPKQSSFPDEEEEEKKNEHCFVLGADFKQGRAKESEHDHQRPLRRFFDEWPQKSGREHSWMGPEADSSKTQLSISIPMGLHDFPL